MLRNVPATIYTLSYPGTQNVFYVGITTQIIERTYYHRYRLKFKPVVEVLEVVLVGPQSTASWQEGYWIQQFIAWGFKLDNTEKIPGAKRRKRKTKETI